MAKARVHQGQNSFGDYFRGMGMMKTTQRAAHSFTPRLVQQQHQDVGQLHERTPLFRRDGGRWCGDPATVQVTGAGPVV